MRFAGVVLAFLVVALPQQKAPSSPDAVPESSSGIVDRFLAQPTDSIHSYRAHRRLEAENRRFRKRAWLEATTEFDRETGFRFAVLAEDGSEMVRKKVLHAALEAERDILGTSRTSGAFTPANYVLTADGELEGLSRIRLQPRRKDKVLVDGYLFVHPESGQLVEVRGRLAKGPSFWTPRVEVTRRWSVIEGVHVPVSVESVASVRLAGQSTFSMRYTYESINGLAVGR